MAYKYDVASGRLRPTTPNSAYGLQSLKPPIPVNQADKVFPKLVWAQEPQGNADIQKAKTIRQFRAVVEKSSLDVHLKSAKDLKLTYRPALLLIVGGLTLATYSAFKLAFLKG